MIRSLSALLGLLLALFASPAHAICDANNTYSFNFNGRPTTVLSYASTYTYIATNPLGASQSFTTSFAINGMSSTQVDGGNGNIQMPRIDTVPVQTASGGRVLNIGGIFSGRTASITSGTRSIVVTFTFSTAIRDLALTVHDIDYANDQFRDWLFVSGSNGTATYTPTMTGPFGNNNSASPTATNSSVRFGPYTGTNPDLTASEAIGTAASNNNTTTGNINISFPQPVTSVTLRYGNFPYIGVENSTGQQFMGISTLTFCPMPVVQVEKSSTPYQTMGDQRFATPGSDISYALKVTNSGGSPVDLGSLVLTDVLPANVTFYNGDYNASSVGMGPFELTAGSSGVTLPASSRAYSSNGGSSYTYAPVASYDPNVRAFRLTPLGTMAANSTFTIRFRARVN